MTPPPEAGAGRRSPSRLRGAALGLMVAAAAAYAVLHTALRGAIADWLGLSHRGCYLCAPSIPGFNAGDAIAALVLICASVLAASAITSRFDGRSFERPLTFGLVTAALIVAPAAALGGIGSLFDGAYLRPPAGPLIAALPSFAVIAVATARGWRPSPPPLRLGLDSTLLRMTTLTAGGVVLASSLVSVLHPPAQGDALTYHGPLAVSFWRDGNLTAALNRAPGLFAFAQPGTNELWAGLLRLVGGERLADLCQLPTALLGAAAVAAFARRTGLRAGGARLAACAYLLVPMVALQIGTQANDVTGAAFVMCAIALASAPRSEWSSQRAALLGLALALAVTTKLALLPTVGAVGGFAVFVLLAGRGWNRRAALVPLALFAVSFSVVVAPWWIRNVSRERNPLYPQTLPIFGHGVNVGDLGSFDTEYVPRTSAWPLYPLLEPIDERSGLGPLFALAALPGLAFALAKGRRRPLWLLAGTFAFTLPFWWRFTLHEPRFLLPHIGLALVCVPWALTAVRRKRRALGAALIVVAGLFSVALAVDQQLGPLATKPMDRGAFYDTLYAVDPVVLALPERDGVLQLTGFGLGRVDYASTYPLLGPGQRRLVIPIDSSEIGHSPAPVLRRMQQAKVRYLYVTALPSDRREVERLFSGPAFRLVHTSAVVPAGMLGARRPLFRATATDTRATDAVWRYLYELTGA